MKCKTAQYILKRYTLPERIGTLSKEALGEEMRKRSMDKFGIKDAESLIGLARETVGIKEGLTGIFMDIRHILIQLEAEGRFISEQAGRSSFSSIEALRRPPITEYMTPR